MERHCSPRSSSSPFFSSLLFPLLPPSRARRLRSKCQDDSSCLLLSLLPFLFPLLPFSSPPPALEDTESENTKDRTLRPPLSFLSSLPFSLFFPDVKGINECLEIMTAWSSLPLSFLFSFPSPSVLSSSIHVLVRPEPRLTR